MTSRPLKIAVLAFVFALPVLHASPASAAFPPFVTSWSSSYAYSIAPDNAGFVYVADPVHNVIRKYTDGGAFVLQWGSGGNGDGQFNNVCGVAADGSGHVYVADTGNRRIQKFSAGGAYITQWGSFGNGNGQFYAPYNLAVDPTGTRIYVTDQTLCRVQVFDPNGAYVGQWGSYGGGNGQFGAPYGVAVNQAGEVYVSDNNAYCRIEKFTATGSYILQWGSCYTNNLDTQDCGVWGLAVGPDGGVYAADAGCNMIKKFTPTGTLVFRSTTILAGVDCPPNYFSTPYGVGVDALGNMYVASSGNYCVQKYGPGGTTPTRGTSWGTLRRLYR